VHPDYRREGIARKMLDTVINICKEKKIERLCLEVKESNISAIKLYESFGFKTDGVRKRYYQNKYDAYLMSLDLTKD
ncbi:MAG: GNAT family N-acetyltransferase, partial [Monoglobaceae bacterium]